MRAAVLVVDDERSFRVMAEEALSGEGLTVRTAANLALARRALARETPDVMILDRRLPDGDGIELLSELTGGPVTIMVTAYGDIDSAIQALRAGAAEYLTKPLLVADLIVKVERALERRGLNDRLALAESALVRPPIAASASPAYQAVERQLTQVSASPLTPVLITGPSGAGKQRAAELLHGLTYRGQEGAPFVELNCAALPAELVESELFGHERGAFTDAKTTRRGLAELASGGTLFLDEVTELPERAQAKLLKFLDTMTLRRVGGERPIEVSLRVVAASNQDVPQAVRAGDFRADLYHRLSVFTVAMPRLCDRRCDIIPLAESFVDFFAGRLKKRTRGLTKAAQERLLRYDFPGNVRELRNIMERAVILASGAEVGAADVLLGEAPPVTGSQESFFSVQRLDGKPPPPLAEVENAYLQRVLAYAEGRRVEAARLLGISYPAFLRRLRELGLDTDG